MFRDMRRFKQQVSNDKCKEILTNEWRGVLSVLGDDDYPYGVPMNFYYDEKDNAIYFHCAKEGHKIDAINKHNKCSFTVFDKGVKRENHWSKDFTSVIVFGKVEIVENREIARDKVKSLAEKYFPDHSEISGEMNAHFKNALCLKLTIEHISGKQINES